MPAADERVVTMTWKGPLSTAMLSRTRYLDVEGAIRSGKTTMALWKVLDYCIQYPGIQCLIARYTDDALVTIVKPVWRRICLEAGVALAPNAEQHYDELPNGSRVYLRGLKSSDDANRYAKFRGMTLAIIYIDQTEEVPADYWPELCGRLSQKGFPQQILLTPNPPSPDHWIARAFPDDQRIAGHELIRVSTYDNAHNLDERYIPELEAKYPPGSAKRGPLLLGLRGLNVIGRPVYGFDAENPDQGGYFDRLRHVGPVQMNPMLPLLEAIDFGKRHPCVIWGQFTPFGGMNILGGLMGQDLFLEDFAPALLRYRHSWFPNPLDVQSCCDPAGSHNNSQGVNKNGVTVLKEHLIYPRYVDNSNSPEVRRFAIESLAGYMRKRTPMGEAFQVHPTNWVVLAANGPRNESFLINGLEAGYVWDAHARSVGAKSITVPVKDGYFEHGQNCLEYLDVNFGGAQPTQQQVEQRAERMATQAVRRAQKDYDPMDRLRTPQRGGRGGY